MADPKVFYATAAITVASSPTDVFAIKGAANKTVRLKSLLVGASATSGAPLPYTLVKRSADNTGGTRAAMTAIAADGVATSAAGVFSYSANPSGLGAAVGSIRNSRVFADTVASGVTQPATVLDGSTPFTLKATDIVALNLGASAPSGTIVYVTVVWDEI